MTRVWAAFSPVANLRGLFERPRHALPQVDGLRALALAWLLAHHAYVFGLALLPRALAVQVEQSLPGFIASRGDFAVDAFFVLAGFLAGRALLGEIDASGRVAIGRFYARRALRLLPAYWVVLAVCTLSFPGVPSVASGGAVALSAVFLGPFVPVARQTMAWAWSLAVTVQFVVASPFLVARLERASPRAQVAVIVALVSFGAVATALLAAWFDLSIDDLRVGARGSDGYRRAFDAVYDKPYTRLGPLFVGVGVCLLDRSRFVPAMIERPLAAAVGAFVAVGLIAWAVALTHDPARPRVLALLAIGAARPAFALGVGFLLLLSLSPHPLGRLLAAALDRRPFRPVARLAFSASLVNPLCALWFARHTTMAQTDDPAALLIYSAWLTSATFAWALLLYLFVERPLMSLRPPRPTPW